MARFKDVEFSNGQTQRIYAPPTQRIRVMVEQAFPKPARPQVPEMTNRTPSGREQTFVFTEDPEYLARVEHWEKVEVPEWEAFVAEEVDKRGSLFVFKDLEVPEDWDVEAEVGMLVRLDEPDWKPTPGEMGRKRDYIQWELLADPEDALKVQITLMELTGIPAERIDAFLASFRNSLAGETSQ